MASDGTGAICSPPEGGTYSSSSGCPSTRSSRTGPPGLHQGRAADLDREIERLHLLGAAMAWEETFPPPVASQYRNVVMRDPEGNEFCLGAGEVPG